MDNSYLPMDKLANVTAPSVFQRTMHLAIKVHKISRSASNHGLVQGHPNENIVQNHLNIVLLNVFSS